MPGSRQLARVEAVTRSPIYAHFHEALTGLTSVRAFGMCDDFLRDAVHNLDVNSRAMFMGFDLRRWLDIQLETMNSFGQVITCSIAVASAASINAAGWRMSGYAPLAVMQ